MLKQDEIESITVQALNHRIEQGDNLMLLDVREPHEVELCRLPDAVHIPMNLIPNYLDQIPDDIDIIVYCHHGIRSYTVVKYLQQTGFESAHLFNLEGGIDEWAKKIDKMMRRY
ncbi:rhodanese-like domain-containing protein [Utexia brackfieldae]|uniref:rhodanese-like domain-containing protein n=1 Tax=Utexia brackfieldae TaxID=3074108 RepID=UPI00370D073F